MEKWNFLVFSSHSTGGKPWENSVGSWTDDAITACFYPSTFAYAAGTCTHTHMHMRAHTHIHCSLKYRTNPRSTHSSEHIFSLLFILTTLTLLFFPLECYSNIYGPQQFISVKVPAGNRCHSQLECLKRCFIMDLFTEVWARVKELWYSESSGNKTQRQE